ncbi:hypothetical protein CDAR_238041 [Caerostris darwini]|uniref:Uncharacterized protein n=1 Tax=Caerostris darwini TaxID=1538125 RepID=A0AAV4S3H6_9ARAC|nr:hypothetical protein CDAR_238041 [Caerostris darwini]
MRFDVHSNRSQLVLCAMLKTLALNICFKRPWGLFSGLRQVGPSRIRDQWKEQREEEAPGATAKLAVTSICFKRPWGSFSGLRQVGPSRIRDHWKEQREEEAPGATTKLALTREDQYRKLAIPIEFNLIEDSCQFLPVFDFKKLCVVIISVSDVPGDRFLVCVKSSRHVFEINGKSKERKRLLVQLQNWLKQVSVSNVPGDRFLVCVKSGRHVFEINEKSKEKKRLLVQLQNWL